MLETENAAGTTNTENTSNSMQPTDANNEQDHTESNAESTKSSISNAENTSESENGGTKNTSSEESKSKQTDSSTNTKSLLDVTSDTSDVITDWSQHKVTLPDGMVVNKNALESFGETAVAAGLTHKQADALIKWQLDEIRAQQQALYEAGKEILQKEWGRKYAANQKAVIGLITRIDKSLGNDSFSKGLNASGAALNPAVIQGLHQISKLISEDSVGGANSVAPEQSEDALQGIENALREQLSRRRKETA